LKRRKRRRKNNTNQDHLIRIFEKMSARKKYKKNTKKYIKKEKHK